MTPIMIEALCNLLDGKPRHGAYVLPGRDAYQRGSPLRALKERGLIAQIRELQSWGTRSRVEWCITDAGRTALAETQGS